MLDYWPRSTCVQSRRVTTSGTFVTEGMKKSLNFFGVLIVTISTVWRRQFAGVDEIIFASDSRLSAGYRWDCAQKIFPIEGPNFCISFAGHADFAFPCIFQFQCMVKNYPRFSTGAAPISVATKDFLAIVNQLHGLVDDRILAQFHETEFLLAGYDFQSGEMYGKSIRYDKESNMYKRFDLGGLKSGQVEATVGFAGDGYQEFFCDLGNRIAKQKTELNYQPLETLNDIISRQSKDSTIGGNPQIVKVYRHRNFLPYAVRQNPGSDVTLFGRPLLEYERTLYPIVSMDKVGKDDFVHYPMGASTRKQTQPGNFYDE